MKRVLSMILCLLLLPAVAGAATPGEAFLDLVRQDVADGRITPEQSLLYRFQYGFAPDSLPEAYRPDAFSPLKCATPLLAEYAKLRDGMTPETVKLIDSYLQKDPAPAKATYVSPGGHFRMTYLTTGADAVPTADLDPANGIPDFVERCAEYLEASWTREIDELGFTAPPLPSGYYEIDFESMDYYGYTSSTGATSTTITLHNTYEGFPANDDPDGNVLGAAKVTCAHEFKHASQRAQSGWSEGGWVELDATWAEDMVFDATNDYYNYLPSDSPISDPGLSLDDGGTGSYEDCVWQHYLTETHGAQIVPDLWARRAAHSSEAMMTSYATVLGDYDSSLREAWGEFVAWNYATGTRAIAGLGYGEAAGYPTGSLTATYLNYPIVRNASVERIAAHQLHCDDLPDEPGAVRVVFDGDTGQPLALTAVIRRGNGTGVIESVTLDEDNDADVLLSVPGDQIAWFGLVVGNASTTGAAGYGLTVEYVADVPDPALSLDRQTVNVTLVQGSTGQETLSLGNGGEAGSTLTFDIDVYPTLPVSIVEQIDRVEKSVAGSSFAGSLSQYVPGGAHTATFTVTNGSPDMEWLTDVSLDFPAGFTVTGSTDFVGGAADMPTGGETGDGARVTWHGTSDSGWGVIQGGQTATATVSFTVAAGTGGDQDLAWTIIGDQYGQAPHSVSGTLTLAAAEPTAAVGKPNGGEIWAIGALRTLNWTAELMDDVKIELSRDGGANWEVVLPSTPNDGAETWAVTGPASSDCLLRVGSLDGSTTDVSDAAFEIYAPVTWLTVYPETGTVDAGTSQPVTLEFDAAGLAIAPHAAVLVITHDGPGSPTIVPVTLTVTRASAAPETPGPAFALQGNHPNPFNPATHLTLRLPHSAYAVVEVLDVRGRLLRTLFDGTLSAGRHELRWDGCDDAGRELASGLYLARLRSEGRTATHKMLLAR